jgi:hypothetical protein
MGGIEPSVRRAFAARERLGDRRSVILHHRDGI